MAKQKEEKEETQNDKDSFVSNPPSVGRLKRGRNNCDVSPSASLSLAIFTILLRLADGGEARPCHIDFPFPLVRLVCVELKVKARTKTSCDGPCVK